MVYDNPPSYDYATKAPGGDAGNNGFPPSSAKGHPETTEPDAHLQPGPPPLHAMQGGPPYAPLHEPATVHHYINPLTGEHIVSVLPPNHPEMICLQEGRHIRRTKFGLLGVLAAVFWFPLGIGLCLLDRRVRCERCGYILEDGLMCG